MTENELRERVAGIVNSWLGATMGSEVQRGILDIYNAHKPLARGYKVKVGDYYCATTVSAAWIKAGIAEYTGTECSCNELIRIAKAKGIWVEDDGHTPKIGDAVLYDWQDSGAGDNVGEADHIGIVVSVSGGGFVVTEGNMSGGKVGQRSMRVDGKNIRGFICPDYGKIAEDMMAAEVPVEASSWAKEAAEKAVAKGVIKGYGNGDYGWRENVTREELAVILDRLGVM